MLQEDYCSYEVAKLLKEKGFDWDCIMLTIWLAIFSYVKNSLLLGIVAGICGGVYVALNTYTK